MPKDIRTKNRNSLVFEKKTALFKTGNDQLNVSEANVITPLKY